ncbi:MAG: DUF47 family protein [Bacilli bacterium]|nr:DUF47 family protein [Bacilli bacterium]
MFKKKKSNYYFDSFPELSHYSIRCGEMILDYMKNYDPKRLWEIKQSVHEIEHEADDKKKEVSAKLLEEFMPPIESVDIIELLAMIDDITDAVEEISLKLYLYNYETLPPDTVEFMEMTVEGMKKVEEAFKVFPSFLEKEIMEPKIQDVLLFESASDAKYIDDVASLYRKEMDQTERHKAETMYSLIENVGDKCHDVVKYIETIIYKNL